jgi:hypothetical protein
LYKSEVFETFPLLAGPCCQSATGQCFPAPRRVSVLIFSRNTASDQDEGNSKTGRLTPLSAKQSHLLRGLSGIAKITMHIVGNLRAPCAEQITSELGLNAPSVESDGDRVKPFRLNWNTCHRCRHRLI